MGMGGRLCGKFLASPINKNKIMVSIYEEVIKTQKKQTKNIYPFN
jgi:hypothetical protein